MTSIALERSDVIVGVDTHKDQHVAVAINGLGARLGELFIDATNPGYAEHAARSVLAGTATVTAKLADGQVEAIRLVKIARDTAVKAHTTAIVTLKAVLVTAAQELRDELEPLTDYKLITACATLYRRPRPSATRARNVGVDAIRR